MGTTADKVAAMTLLLQESAVSNLRSLDELLRWVSKRSGARAVAGQVHRRSCFPDLSLPAHTEHPPERLRVCFVDVGTCRYFCIVSASMPTGAVPAGNALRQIGHPAVLRQSSQELRRSGWMLTGCRRLMR